MCCVRFIFFSVCIVSLFIYDIFRDKMKRTNEKKSKKNKKKQKHLNFAHLRRIVKQINIRTSVKIGKREREREKKERGNVR